MSDYISEIRIVGFSPMNVLTGALHSTLYFFLFFPFSFQSRTRDSVSHFLVRRSVGRSVGPLQSDFFRFCTPAHPSATNAAVYTAFFFSFFLFPFLVADTRFYTLPCWLVRRFVCRFVRRSHFGIATSFCITAFTQPSATVLSCIRPCFFFFPLILSFLSFFGQRPRRGR